MSHQPPSPSPLEPIGQVATRVVTQASPPIVTVKTDHATNAMALGMRPSLTDVFSVTPTAQQRADYNAGAYDCPANWLRFVPTAHVEVILSQGRRSIRDHWASLQRAKALQRYEWGRSCLRSIAAARIERDQAKAELTRRAMAACAMAAE